MFNIEMEMSDYDDTTFYLSNKIYNQDQDPYFKFYCIYMESNITDMKMITPFTHSILCTLFQHSARSPIRDSMML